MNELTIKELSDLIYDKLEDIGDELILDNPNTESKFPCRTIHTPLEVVLQTLNAIPIKKRFQVTISHWNDKQRECMEMASITDANLRKYNFTRTNTTAIIRDDIVQKYRLDTSYEVVYNALNHSFYFTK